ILTFNEQTKMPPPNSGRRLGRQRRRRETSALFWPPRWEKSQKFARTPNQAARGSPGPNMRGLSKSSPKTSSGSPSPPNVAYSLSNRLVRRPNSVQLSFTRYSPRRFTKVYPLIVSSWFDSSISSSRLVVKNIDATRQKLFVKV